MTPLRRAPWKERKLLFLPACVALLLVMVMAAQAVFADHGEVDVSLVPPGAGPNANYSENPLRILWFCLM